MKHGSLFSGIGGFDLAAQCMGWENVFQVEIDKFCQKVLEKNFPNVKRYGDIKEFDGTEYSGQLDILTGGFPCQPFSVAGKRKGAEDDRFLWHEMLRAIREIQPTWAIAENVGGLITQGNGLVFEQVCAEMEKEGYEVQPFIIPACAINAPHRRDRVWFIANSCNFQRDKEWKERQQRRQGRTTRSFLNGNGSQRITTNSHNTGLQGSQVNGSTPGIRKNGNQQPAGFLFTDWKDFPTVTPLCGRDDGIPQELHIIKRLENDKTGNKKSNTEISYATWKVLREMWEQREIATTSPNIYFDRLYNSLPEMPREGGSGTWITAYKEDENLCSMWEGFYALSYEEAQDLQHELLINLRTYKCSKTMEQKTRVDRIKALGNSIVPQVAYEIFKAISSIKKNPPA